MMYWIIVVVLFIVGLVVLDVLRKLKLLPNYLSSEQYSNFVKLIVAILCAIWPFTLLGVVVAAGFFALCFLVNKLTGRISGAIVRKLSNKVPK